MRNLIKFLVIPLIFSGFCACVQSGNSAGETHPNVLLILCDDMGAMELECYGSTINRTPNLDQLAEEGTRFNTFFATPVCSPTRVCLMTGKYGYKTGWLNMRGRLAGGPGRDVDLANDEYTFGQMFQDHGYKTAVAGKWQLTGGLPEMVFECGFDEYLIWIYKGYLPKGEDYKGGYQADGNKTSRFWQPGVAMNGKHIPTNPTDYGPDMYSDFLIDFMRKSVSEDKPFFVYYPMVLMHTPWERTPDHPDITKINSPEAKKANVEYADKIVGKLMKAIKELNVEDNTLVIFIGDNGTQDIGKSTVTEWGPRTPCIIKCPGTVKKGVISTELVELSDILPTMLDYTGIQPKNHEELDGISLMPLLSGKETAHRDFIWSFYGQFRVIREKEWLLEHNSVDDFGDLYYCGDHRNGLKYKLITDFSDPETQKAKARFEDHISNLPVPEFEKDLRDEFDDFVMKKKKNLLKSLNEIYDEDYGLPD